MTCVLARRRLGTAACRASLLLFARFSLKRVPTRHTPRNTAMLQSATTDRLQFTVHLDRPRCCVRCRETYTQRDNYGTHECRFFHALPLVPDGSRFACCDRRPDAEGCVPADHTDGARPPGAFRRANTTLLSNEEYSMFGVSLDACAAYVRSPTWRLAPDGQTWIIDRVDFTVYERQRNVGCKPATPVYALERWRPEPDTNQGLVNL